MSEASYIKLRWTRSAWEDNRMMGYVQEWGVRGSYAGSGQPYGGGTSLLHLAVMQTEVPRWRQICSGTDLQCKPCGR